VGGSQLVGLHNRGAFDDAGIDQCLTAPSKQFAWVIPVSTAISATDSRERRR
jgi:hypothetical protein